MKGKKMLMNKKTYYLFHGGECDDCAELDGMIFDEEDCPKVPLHPHCRCWIEKIEETNSPLKPKGKYDRLSEKDKALIDKHFPVIEKYERPIDWPYLDSKDKPTVGLGINISNKEIFNEINWETLDGFPMTPDEKEHLWEEIEKMQKDFSGKNYNARFFRDKTHGRISGTETKRLTKEHLAANLPEIRETLRQNDLNFDKLPEGIQQVLIDIKYNTGHLKFPNMIKAIKAGEIVNAAIESHRADVNDDRNNWAADSILNSRSYFTNDEDDD